MEQKQFDELKTQLDTSAKSLDAKVDAMNEQAEAGVKIGKENTKELQEHVKKHTELQKQIDEVAAEFARKGGQPFGEQVKLPAALMQEAFEASGDFKALREKGKGRASIKFEELTAKSLEQKAPMFTGGTAPGTTIMPQYVPGIVAPNLRRTVLLDMIPVAPTTSNSIIYVREANYDSNGKYVAEGDLKPEDDLGLAQVTAPVQTLATTMRISKQLLDDLPALIGYISARVPRKLQLVKEQAVIYGSGTGAEIQGLAPIAAQFAADPTLRVVAPNQYDVLGAAILQAQIAEYFPTGIVIHPLDEFQMLHAKDSQNRYLFPEMRDGYIGSVPYAVSTLVALKGNFLVGDMQLGAQLFQRQGLEIELFDQDRDNVVRNLITIRAEERHVLAVYRPQAFVYGNFVAAATAIKAV